MRLLLIEDNAALAELISEGLGARGFAVDRCGTYREALAAYSLVDYDLMVVDRGLPDGDGLDFVRQLRRESRSTPVLILTARGGLDDRLSGLDGGADDYLVKPFELAELAARCRALLRRPGTSLAAELQLGNVVLDPATRAVTVDARRIEIPPREIALLELLLRRAGQVVLRAQLEASLYSMGDDVTPNALETAVSRLRKRLTAAGASVTVRTAHGLGYSLLEAKHGDPAS